MHAPRSSAQPRPPNSSVLQLHASLYQLKMKFAAALLLALAWSGAAAQGIRGSERESRTADRRLDADAYIFQSADDGYAQAVDGYTSAKVGTPCSTSSKATFVEDPAGDYINVATTKWHSGGYRMECFDKGSHTNWNCAAECSLVRPNFRNWDYLTFEARASGTFDDGCKPTISLLKGWPAYSSNVIALEGEYVNGGALDDTDGEWRTVVIPTADFATDEWADLGGVKDMFFRSCGTSYSLNPTYQIRGLLLTDAPPSITVPEATPDPTKGPTASPTTATPTVAPSDEPTESPTEAYWPVWDEPEDSYAPEDESTTCFEQKDRTGITVTDNEFDSSFSITPDAWVSGGIRFGCVGKDASHQCVKTCYPFDGSSPDWSDKLYLTFLAKVEGTSPGCKPSVTLTGGGWPRKSSNKIYLEGAYVDAGSLSDSGFGRVVIPLADMKTAEWDLSNLYGMYFQTCGMDSDGVAYPLLTYHVASVAVTNQDVSVVSMPPTSAPTPFVPDDILLATHRFIHTNWYPLFGPDREPAGHSWVTAQDDAWPDVGSVASHSTTVHIPAGQSVVYSGSDANVYDKVIVEGSLAMQPVDGDVKLIVGTIVVEEGGSLDITTNDGSPYTVTIETDGALDHSTDPEEIMLGVLVLQGDLTVAGNSVPAKMAPLSQTATAGSNVLVLDGIDLAASFEVGGELVLPDTQEGLNVGHWNFPHNDNYSDQTESCFVESIAGNEITCESAFLHDHKAGCNAAYVTRSVKFVTSPSSTDRGHILHTGGGHFEVRNAQVVDYGRTTTDVIDSTVMAPNEALRFHEPNAQMVVSHQGTNQIARYALHAHHSLVEAYFTGNAVMVNSGARDGMVAHNSRVHIIDNVIVGANGTGIFLEDATETGPVLSNYLVGTGGGSRGGDDGRFSSELGKDMAHGGFGIWCRGKLALVQGNHAEGHFGVAPYAFFVHPNFISDKRVPDVPGTPAELVGKKLKDIDAQLQTYGGFVENTAVATFKVGIDLSYFSVAEDDTVGSIIEGADITSLAMDGRGISTTHSKIFTLNDVTIEGTVPNNTITAIWCNNLNCDGCTLQTPNTTLTIENVETARGGNC